MMLTVGRVRGLIGVLGFVAHSGTYDDFGPHAEYLSDHRR
jgi:hypothetical protein